MVYYEIVRLNIAGKSEQMTYKIQFIVDNLFNFFSSQNRKKVHLGNFEICPNPVSELFSDKKKQPLRKSEQIYLVFRECRSNGK